MRRHDSSIVTRFSDEVTIRVLRDLQDKLVSIRVSPEATEPLT